MEKLSSSHHSDTDHRCHQEVKSFWSAEERKNGHIESNGNMAFLFPHLDTELSSNNPVKAYRDKCRLLLHDRFDPNAHFWKNLEKSTDQFIDDLEDSNHMLLQQFAPSAKEQYLRLPILKAMIKGFRIEVSLINFGFHSSEGIQFNGTPLHGHPIFGMMDKCFGAQGKVTEKGFDLVCKADGKRLIENGKINQSALCTEGYLKKDQIELHQSEETIIKPGERATIRELGFIKEPQFDGLIHPHLFTGSPFHSIIVYMGYETRCQLLKGFLKAS
ncbi:MAG: hypothetical protein P1V18_01100 [Candidatus Gracilibacteria bacterium]|nr:hypothetical protein [Candidatus Gracilibacteria bacterium]